ncbi:MAG: ArgE/DapE family deacylase [Candidatus Jordarchaeaceae archaeon]
MSETWIKILETVDKEKEKIVDLVSQLIRIPSTNPPGDTSEVAGYISDYLNNLGIKTQNYESKPGLVSIVAKVGRDRGKKILLNGHVDVVPVGDAASWMVEPFSGKVYEGQIWGRGASDMKGGVAAILSTLSILQNHDVLDGLQGAIECSIVPDEETDGYLGTGWLIDKGIIKEGDLAIIAEGTISPLFGYGICVMEKGGLTLKLKSKGAEAHGGMPFLGDNAIEKLMRILPKIKILENKDLKLPHQVIKLIEKTKPLYQEVGKLIGFPEEKIEPFLKQLLVNITRIAGGVADNVIPAEASAIMDVRIPPGITIGEVYNLFSELIVREGKGDFILEQLSYWDPSMEKGEDSPAAKLVEKAILKVDSSAKIYHVYSSGGSDAKFFRAIGIPTVLFGPGQPELAHSANERIIIQDLVKAVKIYLTGILDYLAPEDR